MQRSVRFYAASQSRGTAVRTLRNEDQDNYPRLLGLPKLRKEIQGMTEDRKQELWLKAMECGARYGCHQRADRSFFIGQWQFPVCARCTGVLIGHIIGFPFAMKKRVSPWAAVCLCEVMLADWVLQAMKIKGSTNTRRLVTGIAGGFGTAVLYFKVWRRILSAVHIQFSTKE